MEGLNEVEIHIHPEASQSIKVQQDNVVDLTVSPEKNVIRGVDGFSPIAKVTQESDGARITITDLNGTTTAIAKNGERGEQGIQGERGERGIQGEQGEQGIQGIQGEQGIQGIQGNDGFSPIATVTKSGDTATITITDKVGTTSASISDGTNGTNGQNGEDGFSPIATVSKTGNTATITITDKVGTTTASISDGTNGTNGQNGEDGFSPIANVSQSGGITTISITDKVGTTTSSITIPTKTSDLTNDGSNNTSTYVEASSLATVATSGSYPDLHNRPTIGNGKITIQKNSTEIDNFTVNQTGNKTINIGVPTKTSELTNDGSNNTSTYVEASSLATVATSGSYSDLSGTPTIPPAPKLIDLSGQIQTESYHRSVIALCRVSTSANTELNSWSSGRIILHRTNGLSGVRDIHVEIENQYASAYYTNISYLANLSANSASGNIDTSTGFRPCTFKYNNVYYGGIEVYVSAVSLQHAFFTGVGNFDVFGLDYYSVARTGVSGSVLNSEVYNSLNYAQFTKTTSAWTS